MALIQSRSYWKLPTLLRLSAAMAVLPAVAVFGPLLAERHTRPAPATYDTLARFLPAGFGVVSVDPTWARGVYRFEAARSLDGPPRLVPGEGFEPIRQFNWIRGDVRGEISADGKLLWLASAERLSNLPADLRRSLPPPGPGRPRVDRVRIMAYEIETTRPDGSEHERFLDGRGRPLFEVRNGLDETSESDKVAIAFEDLAPPVAKTIRRYLGQRLPTRLRRELELGSRVIAAKWRSGQGEQEVKVLENGLPLFLELPRDEPVPSQVLSQLPEDGEAEALILETYSLRDANGEILGAVLANGMEISAPTSRSFG